VTRPVALKRLVQFIAGQSPPSDDVGDYDGEGLPFLQGNAEFGPIYPLAVHRCDSASRRCTTGDILLSIRAPVGALNKADRSYGIGRGLCAVRAGNVDPRFLWWLLHAEVNRLLSIAVGSTYDAVTSEDIGSLRVSVPVLTTQRAIADYLDAETARIDALIEKKREMVKVLDEAFESYRASEVLQGFNPVTGVGDIPEGWKVMSLGVLVELQRGHDLPSDARREGPVPVVSSGGVSGWHDSAAARGPGVVTGRYGTVGAVYYVEGDYWPLNTTLYVKSFRGCEPRWTFYLLATLPLDIDAAKSAVTGINRNAVGTLRTPVPPPHIQRRIAVRLDNFSSLVTRTVALLTSEIDLLTERRQALITAAVTGELPIARVAA
jgi:type I restriction enzyme S subunit